MLFFAAGALIVLGGGLLFTNQLLAYRREKSGREPSSTEPSHEAGGDGLGSP